MNNQYDEEIKVDSEDVKTDNKSLYKNVLKTKENRRTLSVISLAIAVLSVLLLFIPWLGLLFSIAAIATGVFSRRNLGYFDKLTLSALIISIFGFVFSIVGIIFGNVISFFF